MKYNIGLLKEKLNYHQNLSKLSYDKIDSNGDKISYDTFNKIGELTEKYKNTPDDIYQNNKNIIISQDLTEMGSKCFNIIVSWSNPSRIA